MCRVLNDFLKTADPIQIDPVRDGPQGQAHSTYALCIQHCAWLYLLESSPAKRSLQAPVFLATSRPDNLNRPLLIQTPSSSFKNCTC